MVLPHIERCSATLGLMELGLGDSVSNVEWARVGDCWLVNFDLLLDGLAKVMLVELADSAAWEVVVVVLQVDEELLPPV